MKKFILTEEEKIRIRGLYEQSSDKTPAISSINVMPPTPTGMDEANIDFTGTLGVVNCDENPNTTKLYTQNNMRLDGELIQQAIGDNTKITVFYRDNDKKLKYVDSHEQEKDNLIFDFTIPKNKIPNLSNKTEFVIAVLKNNQEVMYNGNVVAKVVIGHFITF